jgi:uncharacterized membrane protein
MAHARHPPGRDTEPTQDTEMDFSKLQYFPLALPHFSLLAGIFLVLVAWIEVRALRLAYMHMGLGSRAAILLLLTSLAGSYLNIPVARLPEQQIISGQEVPFFGMHYVIPVVIEWPGTVVAVNVGGAVIPGLLSFYLLVKNRLWVRGLLATAGVTAVCHLLARPVPGLGIALPVFVPPISAAVAALLFSRRQAAPLAYIGGSLGTLIGADLLNLDKIQGLRAPVASIGGAGTFDGIFLTGILAVLLASLFNPPDTPDDRSDLPRMPARP